MVEPRFPSLTSIRAFEAAARLGSFARAAHDLGTSAASVSYHVRQLETQLGMTLFRRHAQRVELTEPGTIVAREAIDAFASLRTSFTRARDVDEARLSLTALPTFGTSWLTPRLGRFRALHPLIRIELDLSPDAQDLAGGHFDAAVRNGHGRWPGMHAVHLFPSIFTPLCSPELRDIAERLGEQAALGLPLLGRPDWWAIWYRALGLSEPLPASFGTTLATEHLDITAALSGHGIAIGSPILFRREIDEGRLIAPHPQVVSTGREFWLVYPKSRQRVSKITHFRDWLVGEAEAATNSAQEYLKRAVPITSKPS